MAKELFPSSFCCDCGQELDFFENTIRDMKKMSKKKRVRLGEGKHTIVFHKGEEMGYVLSGKLQVKLHETSRSLNTGDLLCLKSEIPSQWKNLGNTPARLLWIKIKK